MRFETPPGEQAQVDFAHVEAVFSDEPGVVRKVWLFSLILGYSRLLWARFVQHQDLQTVLRCHRAAFAALGGVPRTILYDRMKTVVTGEPEPGHIVYIATWSTSPSIMATSRAPAGPPGEDQGQGGAAVPLRPPGLLPGADVPQSR